MIVKEILENGLTLLTESMPHVRSVAVGVWLKRGSRHETPEQTGISHFIAHMVEDTPDDLVMELFTQAFWPDHPLGRPILGTKRSVESFRRQDLASFFKRVYHPGNIVIAAAGNLDHGKTAELVRRHFGALTD